MSFDGEIMAAPDPVRRSRDEPRWIRSLSRITDWAARVGGVATILMALHIAADVLSRNLSNRPLPATLEIVGGLWMPAVAILALGYTEARNEQIRVTMAIESANESFQRVTAITVEAISAIAGGWFFVLALDGFLDSFGKHETATGYPWLQLWPGRLILAIGLALFVLGAATRLLRLFLGSAPLVHSDLD